MKKILTKESYEKALLFGLSGCGKTSIVLSLANERNILSFLSLKSTYKIDIKNITSIIDGERYSIWDFGGQEQFREEYLQNFDIYLKEAKKLMFVIDVQETGSYDLSLNYLFKIINIVMSKELKREIEFSIYLHKYDPNLKCIDEFRNIDQIIEKGLIRRIQEEIPSDFNYNMFKSSIFAEFLFFNINGPLSIENQLDKSALKYISFITDTSEGVWIIDSNAITTYVNSKMAAMLGYSTSEMIGKSIYDFMEESLKPSIQERFRKVVSDNAENYELELLSKSGRIVYTIVQEVNLFNDDQAFDGSIKFISDITEKKRSEIRLRESEEKYRTAYHEAEFYQNLFTHDTSNILQNFGLTLEIFKKTHEKVMKEDKEVSKIINKLHVQYKRASELVANIRKITELKKGTKELKKTNLIEILNTSIDFVRKSLFDTPVDISLDTKFQELYVRADNFLRDVFDNLLNNAIKHNESPSIEIKIKVNKVKGEEGNPLIKCEFMDNGEGIPDPLKKRIFIERMKSGVHSGMGIGLTLISKIISIYNGNISIEDRIPGNHAKGTNFIVLIPEFIG